MPQVMKSDNQTKEIASARKIITEQDKSLAKSSLKHFRNKEFDLCLDELNKLSEVRPHDPRVTANKAVAEYYKSNFCKTDEFLKQLSAAKKQLEFGVVNTGDELDDIDCCFLMYNQAVMHFHLKEYKSAVNILERLFKIIEPLGDTLAMKVCILLVEVYLLSYQLEQAHGMISYLENVVTKPNFKENDNNGKTFQSKLFVFKARLLMMRGFHGQARELLKQLGTDYQKPDCLSFLLSNMEYCKGNYRQALILLNNSPKSLVPSESGHAVSVQYFNNLSAVHFDMKKYNLAVLYGSKAVEENCNILKSLPQVEKLNKLSGRPLCTLALNRRSQLLYNAGLCLLYSNNPAKAFDCFIEAQQTFHCNPCFWLRLAECSIAVSEQQEESFESLKNKKSSCVRGVIGAGTHRKVVLSPPIPTSIKGQDSQSAAIPTPTLEFANLCLRNATVLLLPVESSLENSMSTYLQHEKVITGEDENEKIKRSHAGRISLDAPPGEPMQTKEIYSLRASILCCHAYVSLCLGDFYKSLEYSQKLIAMNYISSVKRFLGYVYATESLIKLNRINEAVQQVQPDHLKRLSSFDENVSEVKSNDKFPSNINDARNVLMLNIASVCCTNGDFEKCRHLLKQVVSSELSYSYRIHAILLSVHCELQQGNVAQALELIKRNEVFPSGRLIDRVEAARALAQTAALSSMLPQRQLPGFQNNVPVGNFNGSPMSNIPPGMPNLPVGGNNIGSNNLPMNTNNLSMNGNNLSMNGNNLGSSNSVPIGGIPYPPPGNLLRNSSGIFGSSSLNMQGNQSNSIGLSQRL